jgi:hypothetical protein
LRNKPFFWFDYSKIREPSLRSSMRKGLLYEARNQSVYDLDVLHSDSRSTGCSVQEF